MENKQQKEKMVCPYNAIHLHRRAFLWLAAIILIFAANIAYADQDFFDLAKTQPEKLCEQFDDLDLTIEDLPKISHFLSSMIDQLNKTYEMSITMEDLIHHVQNLPQFDHLHPEQRQMICLVYDQILHHSKSNYLSAHYNGKPLPEDEIPGNLIIGAFEAAAGVLIFILPFPGARFAGGYLVGDGINRTLNGVDEYDKKQRNSSYLEPFSNIPIVIAV